MTARTRKAYRIMLRGYERQPSIKHAPTGSKARAALFSDLSDAWDISWRDYLDMIIFCERAPDMDIILPPAHPLRAGLNGDILHCVSHAYGGKGEKAGYRCHFYANEDDTTMRAALYHGLFCVYRRDPGRRGQPGMIMYALTQLGRNVAAGEVETYPRAWS